MLVIDDSIAQKPHTDVSKSALPGHTPGLRQKRPAVRYVLRDTALDGDQTMHLYQERWQVEVYHKSLKQNASLAGSLTRTNEDAEQPRLFVSVRVREVGDLEDQDQVQSFCAQKHTITSRLCKANSASCRRFNQVTS